MNDPPGAFALLWPPADTMMFRADEAIWDTVKFSWEGSSDAEGDDLNYHFVDQSQRWLFESVITTDTTIYLVPGIAIIGKRLAALDTFTVSWNVTSHDGTDSTSASSGPRTLVMVFDFAIAVEENGQLPESFALHQNYPNPFNPSTTIRFDLPVATNAHLAVYDLLGREVAWLVDQQMGAGYHHQVWNGRDRNGRELPTGMYIALLVTPEFKKSIKIVLLK